MLDHCPAKVTTILSTAPRLGYLPCKTIQRRAKAVTPGVRRGQVAGSSRFHTSTPRSSPLRQSHEGESRKIKPSRAGGVSRLRSRRELTIPHLSGVPHRAGRDGLAPHYAAEGFALEGMRPKQQPIILSKAAELSAGRFPVLIISPPPEVISAATSSGTREVRARRPSLVDG